MVDVPEEMLHPDEKARVAVLATAGDQHGDPDDVPTARLALLLDAPLLTKDHNLLYAVYGPTWDVTAHGEWLNTLRAGGDTGPLGEVIMAGYMLVAGVTVGTVRLVAKLVELFGWPLVGVAGATAALVVRHQFSSVAPLCVNHRRAPTSWVSRCQRQGTARCRSRPSVTLRAARRASVRGGWRRSQ